MKYKLVALITAFLVLLIGVAGCGRSADGDVGLKKDSTLIIESTGDSWTDEKIEKFEALMKQEGWKMESADRSGYSSFRNSSPTWDPEFESVSLLKFNSQQEVLERIDSLAKENANSQNFSRRDYEVAQILAFDLPIEEGFAWSGMKNVYIAFDRYLFEGCAKEEVLNQLIDELGYLNMSEDPKDPIGEFRDIVMSIDTFNEVEDSGALASMTFAKGSAMASYNVSFSELANQLKYKDFAKGVSEADYFDDYASHKGEAFSYVWTIRGGEYEEYGVSIFDRNIRFAITAPPKDRDEVNTLIAELGYQL